MSRAFMIKQAPFKPTDIGGCQLWLDASDTATISLSGSTVTQINDKSGNSNNTSSSTGTVTYTAGGLNSRPAFSFNATGGFRGPTSITGTTLTAFTVATLNSGVNYNGRLLGLANATQNDYQYATTGQPFFCLNAGPNISGYRNNTYMSYQTTTFDIAFIGTSQFTGSSNITSVNGTPGTAVADANGSFSITKYGFGCEGLSASGVNWYGYCSEMILYNSLLSTPQRQQVEAYLAQKWGLRQQLPQGHPGTRGIVYPSQPIPTAIYWRYPSQFVPTTAGNCQLWLDAADSTTLTGTSPVTQWRDKSGNARNTTTYAGTPALTTNAINSVQAINFNGGSSFTGSIPGSGTSYTLFFVGTFNNSTGTYGGFICFGRSGTPDHVSGITNTKLTDSSMYSTIDSTNTAFTSNTLSTPFVYSLVIDGTFLNNFVNGNQQTPANVAKLASFNFTNYVVANRAGSTSSIFLNGYVGEIIVYINSLATLQRQQVEGYLAWKWGLQANLPANHPYKNAAPIGVTNPAGISRPANVLPIPSIVCTAVNRIPSVPSGVITSGLVSFFTFDNTLADSKNTITLSQTGSVSYVTGRRNQAVYLANESNSANGTTATNYLTSSYNITVPFTVVVWFNPTNVTNGSLLSTYNSTAITNYSVNLYIQAAGGGMSAAYNAIQNVGASIGLSIGTWYNAVITVNASNGLSLFVNGSKIGSTITQTPSINGLMIGNISDGGSYAYSGYLEDYRIYNRVLSGTEISQIYAGTG